MHLVTACKECWEAVFRLDNPWKTLVIGLGTVYVGRRLLTVISRCVARAAFLREPGSDLSPPDTYERDVVYLFTFPETLTKQVPNLSPYSIKVETWLKMKEVKYRVVPTTRFSEDTKQLPYIRLNDNFVSDSHRIINYLTDFFEFDPSEGLTEEQQAVSRAIQRMVDDGTSWTYFIDRYTFRPEVFAKVFRPRGGRFLREKIRKGLAKMFEVRSNHQGTGRQKAADIARMGLEDVLAISGYLGDKDYLMGSEITKVDCAVFGHLSQLAFVDFPYAHKMVFTNGGENLMLYLNRIRDRLWPDWRVRADPGVFYD